MKRIFTILAALFLTVSAFAQAPSKMSYQAVIRNSSNQLVTSQAVSMKISILQGSVTGTIVYTETQTPITNANGLVSIEIGGGASFDAINWANGPYFIKTETDPSGGTNYAITGTSQLLSVPYALHSKTAETVLGGITDIAWSLTGSSGTSAATNFIGTTDNVPLTFKVNNQLAGKIDNVLYNTSLGYQALNSNTIGNYNTANGHSSLASNTTGYNNTANGAFSLGWNITGKGNTAIGYDALGWNTTGYSNTANGSDALSFNSTGYSNTANGNKALYYNTTGIFNTAVGTDAMKANIDGNWNTCIGEETNTSIGNLQGASSFGASAIVNADNKIVLGANVAGMVIGGYANWSNLSDGRFKEDIKENVPGLAFITRLRPITYWVNTDKLLRHLTVQMNDSIAKRYLPTAKEHANDMAYTHTGFVAQEVEATAKEIGYTFDGVNAPKNPTDNYSIAYSQFVPSLVKAIQELNVINDGLKLSNDDLKLSVEELKAQNEKLIQRIEKLEAK